MGCDIIIYIIMTDSEISEKEEWEAYFNIFNNQTMLGILHLKYTFSVVCCRRVAWGGNVAKMFLFLCHV